MAKRRGATEGSVFQRKDGLWCATLNLGWEAGKRQRKSFYARTQAGVLEKLARAKHDHRRGLPVAIERQTVSQFLERWLTDSVKPSVRVLSFEQYERCARLYFVPAIGATTLEKLSPQQVQCMTNALLQRGLSPTTVRTALVILRHALDQAVKWNLLGRNVAKLVDLPRVERAEIKPLTPDQAAHFVESVKPARWSAAYITALTLGLRQGELLGLRWKDVNLEQRTVQICQTVQRTQAGRTFSPPKTDRSRRTLRIPESLVATLRAHRIQQLEARLAAGPDWQNLDLIFTSAAGTPIEVANLQRDFKKQLKAAGLPNIRFHDLRHSCASLMLALGIPARTIMEQLGHSAISITMNIYAHITPALLDAAANQLDALLHRRG